jgi:hypothetical protein
MTKLMTPIDLQTDALAYARDVMTRLHRGDSSFEAQESSAFMRSLVRLGLLTGGGRMHLVECALAGDEEADAVLREFIIEKKSLRIELPVELAAYDMRITAGMVPTSGTGGPERKNKLLRNIAICMVIAQLIDRFGLKATGRSPLQRSACSIVGQVLGEIGMALGYEAVATIWRTYGRHLHLRPGWVAAMGPIPQ